MKLVLVRHGQTTSNTTRALDTAMPGAPLDETGHTQAQLMAQNFEELVGSAPDAIFVSPLIRARQTAAALEEKYGLTATVLPGIAEISAGDMEMSETDEHIFTYLGTILNWIQGDLAQQMPGGETGYQVMQRFSQAIVAGVETAYAQGQETVVFVAHGALCRFIAHTLSKDITPELVATFPMHNASTTTFVCSGECPNDLAELLNQNWQALTWSDKPLNEYSLEEMKTDPVVSKLRPAKDPLR
ncbi:histidine phosphatase family protein [Gleimia coleocanis]|nr:histidine phosphatase family protein [Gleimia coleocanis]